MKRGQLDQIEKVSMLIKGGLMKENIFPFLHFIQKLKKMPEEVTPV